MKRLPITFALAALALPLSAQQSPSSQPENVAPKVAPARSNRPPKAKTTTKTKDSKPAEKKTEASEEMPMPKPSPEMERLTNALVGHWDVEEEFLPSPMMPAGAKGKGKETFRSGPGNLSIIMDFSGNMPPGFTGHGVAAWSAEDKQFQSAWTDNMAPMIGISTGKWDGDKLVFTGDSNMNGMQTTDRLTYSDFKPDSFTFTLETGPKGGELKPMMVFRYKRSAGAFRKVERKPEPMATEKK